MDVSRQRASALHNSRPVWRNILIALFAGAMITACTTTEQTRLPQDPGPIAQKPQTQTRDETPKPAKDVEPEEKAPDASKPETLVTKKGLTPPHMVGRPIKRVALLLPFSASSDRLREESAGLLQAAELAVFDREEADVLLITFDTAGTAQGARSAADAAINAGADVIVGPLLAPNVRAIEADARRARVPVIAFSTDQSVAGSGVYLLSFPPEAEIDRIVSFAASEGARSFALLGPDNGYVRRVDGAYRRAVENVGGNYVIKKTYATSNINDMQAPARELAQAHNSGTQRFDAILLPEGGVALRTLGPLLPYYDVNPAQVQFLGTGLWDREDTMREPALRGGIFAGPDHDARRQFEAEYIAAYKNEPTRISSLAYDGLNIAAMAASGDPKEIYQRLSDPRGYYGVDGFVRFRRDGTPERGLAIYQVKNGRFDVIQPAPKSAEDLVN